MKTYAAIGHFEESKNITSVAMKAASLKDFRQNLGGNGFVPYVVITEKKLETLKTVDEFSLFDEVKKMTSNYRKWLDICDYLEQCFDILEEKFYREK